MGCLNPVKSDAMVKNICDFTYFTVIILPVFVSINKPWPLKITYDSGILLINLYESQMPQTNIFTWPAVNIALNKIISILNPRQNGHHFEDDIFMCIFAKKGVCVPIKISLKFVPKGPIIIPALVHIMAWCRPGDKPFFEPVVISL